MLDTNRYLNLAASNFRAAEAHLREAEDGLYALLERLEACSEAMKKLGLAPDLPDTPKKSARDGQLADIKEPEPVSS